MTCAEDMNLSGLPGRINNTAKQNFSSDSGDF